MGGFISAIPSSIALGLIWGIMAIGVYITFRILDVADLTVDGTLATGGATLIFCLMRGQNVYVSMFIAFLAGCVAGLVTGILHTLLGIPAILAGILTQLALYSVNLRILGGSNLPVSPYSFNLVTNSASVSNFFKSVAEHEWKGGFGQKLADISAKLAQPVPSMVVVVVISAIFVVVTIALLYWFFGTEVGHAIRATGCNLNMAKANGINTNNAKIIGLVLSNGLVALSGALLAQINGFADVNSGRGAIVIGLAAVIIGEVLFGKLFKNFALKLFAVAIGGIIYYVVMQFVINLGLNTDDLKLLTAVVVAVALGIPYLRGRYAEKHVKMPKNQGEGNK